MDDFEKDLGADEDIIPEQFSLDDILNEFSDDNTVVTEEPAPEEPAKPIEPKKEGKVYAAEISSDEDAPGPAEDVAPAEAPKEPETPAEKDDKTDYDIVKEYKPIGGGDLDELLKEVRMDYVTDEDAAPAKYASADKAPAKASSRVEYSDEEEAAPEEPPKPEKPERNFAQRTASPFVSLMAMISLRRQQHRSTVKAAPPEEAEDLGPEMDPDRASRYYGSHISNIRVRTKISFAICLVLMYISFGFPVPGRLNNGSVASLFCIIAELAVVVLCLDVFTSGIMDLVRKKPGAGSLIAVSCILSAIDGAVSAANGASAGLPFCAVSALSIACALWSSLLMCKGNRITLRTLALSKNPYTVSAESGVYENEVTLLKTRSDTEDFVRRTEEITPEEAAYSTMAPFLMIAALVLSLAAAVISKSFSSFPHILAAVFMPAAPISALLAFPLPYSIVSRRIFHSGSAIAGWSGTYDIGGSKHLVITDTDIFPKDTVAFESIRILEGTSPQKIIAYTGSVIAASGSGLSGIFTELMKKNHCAMEQIDEFSCHEGGGLTAMIHGEEVLCGSSGFMHLMGIRLPQKLASKNSVFVSVNGMISAIFTISYTPVVTVQRALVSLLHTRRQPIFAIRDFNVTPEMIRHKFRMPTDGFDFPSFSKRYEVSSAKRSSDSKIAAVISRDGLAPLVELSDYGHRLYTTSRLCTLLSVMCTVIGMLMMFFLCMTAAFDSVTVGNMLLYMIFWLLPEFALIYGLKR
jgi:hypothetical protein